MQRKPRGGKPGYVRIVLALAVVLGAGGAFSWRCMQRTDQRMHEDLLWKARSTASAIPVETLAALSGTETDLDSPHYLRLKEHLQQVRGLYPECRFLYLTGRKADGTIFFYVDSEPVGAENESPPGRIFDDADEYDHRVFDTGIAEMYPVRTNRQGARVGVSVPLIEPRTNAVVAVFCMGVDVRRWGGLALRGLCAPLGFTVMLAGIVLGGAALLRWRGRFASAEQSGWLLGNAEAVIAAAVGLALTAMATYEVHTSEQHERRQTFSRLGAAKTASVAEAMRDIRNIQLEGLGRFFESSAFVDRREFRICAEYLAQDPAVQAWGWVPRVAAADRERIEDEARRDGLTDYMFWERDEQGSRIPARAREYYYPVFYLEPTASNEAAFGFDLGSEPVRSAALEKAMNTGLATATDPITLVRDEGNELGILVLRPVFSSNARNAQEGFVVSALRAETLFQHVVKPTDFHLFHVVLDLFQLQEDAPPIFLASTDPQHRHMPAAPSQLLHADETALTLLTPLFAYGKTYVLVAHPSPEYAVLHPSYASRIAAFSGVLIAFILAALVGFLARRREILEAQIRERAEALQESRQILRLVLDSIPVRVFWKDRNSRYLGCNRPFALDAGLADPEDLLGKDDYQMGWREQAELYRADDRRVIESGQPKLYYEEPQTAPDGRRLWLRTSKVPLRNARDEIVGVLGTYEDITVRKQADETLRKLSVAVEQSPASVVITDYEGAIEYVNPKFTALTGYSPAEVLGQNPRILKSGETSQEEYQKLWDTIKAGRVWRGEFHNKKKDGTLYWERALISPIRDDAGNITHFIALKEDITVQKILEDQLRQALKMESVGRLAGGVAHDFNNMLQAILGYADLALDSLALDHPARESIVEVQKAARRSADLTRQLLAFSRRQAIRPVVLDLNNVIAGTLKMLRRIIGEHITLIWKPGMDLWTVNMDPAQVDEVLVNLSANARDAITGVGNLTIETDNVTLDETYCEIHAGCTPGDYVLLAVIDDGSGMDKEALNRIFEPFFTTKETGKGTGLGLAMVYGIVKQNRGFINAYSEPGKGTSFKIYLPRAHGGPVPEPPVIADDRPLDGTETVLLVEDEEAILGFGKAILTRHGYTVLTAKTPGETLALARRHEGPIDLLITDVVMPEMNGKELKDRLAQMLPDLKVLYTSGYTANVIAHHGIIDESIDFLAKPFSPKALAKIVREILDQDGP